MLSKQLADGVVAWAPAKVNLFLEVLSRRADGYHEIATLMVAVSRRDTLRFTEEAQDVILGCDHPALSTGPDNLILRAAELLRRRTGCTRGARIHLVKRIPMAAGLAGGSGDAAATLDGLNRLWRLGLSRDELATLGAEIGSDVPFFFHAPAAWCTGRGERVEPLSLPQPLHLVLACPGVGLPTADVYRGVTVPDAPVAGDAIRQALREGRFDAVGRLLHNRLQPAAERLCPIVTEVNRLLDGYGCLGHLMSGSGSSSFALCRDGNEARRIARRLRQDALPGWNMGLFTVRSCF